MDMRKHIKERADLAHTYACDGAYSRAAQILEELAATVRAHSDTINRAEDRRVSRLKRQADALRLLIGRETRGGAITPDDPR
jgi:DNA transposition AAA+ family ATPase